MANEDEGVKPPAAEEEAAELTEVESIRSARPGTDTNVFIMIIVGIIGTIITATAVMPLKDTRAQYAYGIINQRGPVQYGELIMSFMTAAFLYLKGRIVRNQLRVVASNPIPSDLNMNDDEQLQKLRDNLVTRDDFSWSILLNRLDRAIALWLSSKDVGRVSSWASAESSRDTTSSDSSYALARVLIWAIPILGFIGTVQGLAVAVSGFGVLGGAAEISAIKEAIGQVTVGLGVAFDTTLLALVLTMFLMFPLSAIQRKEEGLFVELDNYLDDLFLARLPSAEQQPIVIENLEDSIEAAFRRYIPDPDRYDEVFTRSIEKAATSVEERFSVLSKNYEATLRDLTDRLASHLSGVGASLEETLQKVIVDLRAQDEAMLAARRDIGKEEAALFKSSLESIHDEAGRVAEEYRKSAAALQAATQEGLSQTVSATRDLGNRLEEISRMAAGIQDLLKIESALDRSLGTIAASGDFRQTLEDLRKHLDVTNQFVTRLSRPRVITLREETA